jgi:hypothetical protein
MLKDMAGRPEKWELCSKNQTFVSQRQLICSSISAAAMLWINLQGKSVLRAPDRPCGHIIEVSLFVTDGKTCDINTARAWQGMAVGTVLSACVSASLGGSFHLFLELYLNSILVEYRRQSFLASKPAHKAASEN